MLARSAFCIDLLEPQTSSRYARHPELLIGFQLFPFDRSIRKQQSKKPKFYFLDTGVTRVLQNKVTLDLHPQSSEFGDLYEQFVILEIIRLNDYYEKHFEFSYFRSNDDVEIDLIIRRPGQADVLVEIKSKDYFDSDDGKNLRSVRKDFASPELYVLSNDVHSTIVDEIHTMHWTEGIKEIFGFGLGS